MNDFLIIDNINFVYMIKYVVFEMILFIKLMIDFIEYLFIFIMIFY